MRYSEPQKTPFKNTEAYHIVVKIYDFGCAIRYLRKQYLMTQEVLAKRSNISRSMIVMVEKNQRNITAEKLGAIANALNIKPQDIYDLAFHCYGNPNVCRCSRKYSKPYNIN